MTVTLRLVLAALAVFRTAQFLAYDEGPFGVAAGLRNLAGVNDRGENGLPRRALGRLFECPYCLGAWLSLGAAALVLLPTLAGDAVLVALAIMGAQSSLQDYSRRGG